ncbi:uncharacterized protein LOC143080959 isoform X2 [Mytilus galloprovincialis]|uniref:uncharacterized protein LOC143080959 isoform X2 n=1 Tax=Mytilus galloprovincialis TaxID=29158 RepID=UPI003F7B7E52
MVRRLASILILVSAITAEILSKRQNTGGCDTKADITFIVDSSDDVGKANFQKQLAFLKQTVNNMKIAPDKTQISVVTFSSGVYNQFFLNAYASKADVLAAIDRIPYISGRTHTSDALTYVTHTSFNPIHGARSNVPHIGVLITDGPSTAKDLTKIQGQVAKDNNIIMYGVGVGSGINMDELSSVSSSPSHRYMLTAENYGALNSLSSSLSTKLCNELPSNPNQLPPPTSCLKKADLAFLVDSSSSVGSGNFQKLENFLKNAVTKLDIGKDKVHVGLMQYSSYPSMQFPLNMYTNRGDTLKAIEGMQFMGGDTNTGDAIQNMRQQMFSQTGGARNNVPRIAIVVTDGGSSNNAKTTQQADGARRDHIGLISVGVGSAVNSYELQLIADDQTKVVKVNSFDQLEQAVDQILQKACTVQSTVAPTTAGVTNAPSACQNKLNNCNSYGLFVCTQYQPWAKDNCQEYCGFCTTPKPTCVDKLTNCLAYGKSSCTQYSEWAHQNCQQYCGFCAAAAVTSGFYGQCSYKGRSYQTGEKWLDGCDYECVCQDGNTGKYACTNRCPLYYNLPKDCTLVKKNGECCQQPVCNFHQTISKTESTGKGRTTNGIDVCVYKGKQYFQRQTWRDGCDEICMCTNSSKGLYQCESICPKYNSIPSNCHMNTAPGECCAKPACEFHQQHGSFTGQGSISGTGVGFRPTTQKPCIDVVNTCSQYGKDVCTTYSGWAGDNCRKFCNLCGGPPVAGQNDTCLYQGKDYRQGQTWSVGCHTYCTCENAVYGYYRCTDICPKYNNMPNGCQEVRRNGECCPIMECDSGSFVTSTTNLKSIGNGGLIHVLRPSGSMQYVLPTGLTGTTPVPGTGGTGFVAPRLPGCLYKGQLYVQDQAWEDGCDFSCLCTNAVTATYACRLKCPTYGSIPASCHMETDPNEPCCKAPVCAYDPFTGQTFVPIPQFQPAVTGNGQVKPPSIGDLLNHTIDAGSVTLYPTGLTPLPPTAATGISGGIGYCLYKGRRYTQAETWDEGCDFTCVCADSRTGYYKCVEKCVHFGNLPQPYCFLLKDPSNPCCKIPKCEFPINFVTQIGIISTAKPATDYCEYGGVKYTQGQSWYDGCSYRCTCENALGGVYRCMQRCPTYQNINPNCKFVPDPNDPSCCQMPQCGPIGNVTVSTGTGKVPTPAPSGVYQGVDHGTAGKCTYKGRQYTQGQQWAVGCDFNCECKDASRGYYECTDMCPRYNNVPPQCKLVTDFTNPCCKKPDCDFTATTASITGNQTKSPNPIPTLTPDMQYCSYRGAKYIQSQTWVDGCTYRCRCDDSSRGVYTCSERCPTYPVSSADCKMVSDPKDPCCLVPQCPPPTGAPNQIPTLAPGKISGNINIPTPKPGSSVSPPLLTFCLYKSKQYKQGEKWMDGCDYSCECTDASAGKYVCNERCTRYTNIPANCFLVKDASNPCCKKPQCTNNTPTPGPYGPTLSPPLNPNTPTPAPSLKDKCVYRGVAYSQGQQWFDDCSLKCVCEDGPAGLYRCSERCAKYTGLPATCTLIPDPQDPICCQAPKCTYTNGTGFATAPPGVISGGIVTPTPQPYQQPTQYPGYTGPTSAPTLAPTYKDVCVYKGKQYNQDQKWQDGCDFDCVCQDSKKGLYKCTEKCPKFVDIPKECTLTRDYQNPCCMKVTCQPSLNPSPGPNASPTPAGQCMYNGVAFNEGKTWDDGCDLRCSCENGTTGYYRCSDRCAKYPNIPSYCTMETDPKDQCCMKPRCQPAPATTVIPTISPYLTPGPGVTYPPNKVPTQYPGQTFAPGKAPTLAPYKPYPPGLQPTLSPFLTPGPGYTYPPGKVPTQYPGQTYQPGKAPTLAPYKPFPPDLQPTASPFLTPGPGYTYPPGKVPTQYPGQTFRPGMEPTLQPNKPFPPDLLPTMSPYLTPGVGYTYPPGRVPTQYPGQTFPPGKEPTLSPYKPFPPNLRPTMSPYRTPGPGYTYPPGKVPPTSFPGEIPTLPPYKPFPTDLLPTLAPYITPGPGYTYPPGKVPPTSYPGEIPTLPPYKPFPKGLEPTMSPYRTPGPGYTYPPGRVPTQYPGQTYQPGKEPTLAPNKPFPPGLMPTMGPYRTPGPGYTYPPGKVPTQYPGQTFQPGKEPTLPPYQTFRPDLLPTQSPYLTPGPGYTYPPGLVPTEYPGQTFAPGKEPTLAPNKPFPPGLGPTMSPYLTPGPGYTYPPGRVPTQFPGQTFQPGKEPTLSPYKPFPPNLLPTMGPYLTPGPGYTYPPGKVPPTSFPGEIPTLSPFKPFPPDLMPTQPPYITPGPGYTYPPGKVPTQYPGQTYKPGQAPTLAPNKPFPPGLLPTQAPYLTPGYGYTYPQGYKIPTQFPGQTFPPGQIPTLEPNKPFPPGLGPTLSPYLTPGPGYTYPPGQVPPTRYPGEIPTLAPYKPFPPGLGPTISPYLTPGPGYTYPPGKVPTQYPGQTFKPGKEPTLPPYKPFPTGLLPTLSPLLTPGPDYTYPPGKVPTQYPGQTFQPGKEPTLAPYQTFPPGLRPTMSPYLTPGPGVTYPPGKVPTQYPGQTYQPGKEPTLVPNLPYPSYLLPTLSPYRTPGPGYTYPPGKVPPTNFPGEIPTLPPYKPFPTDLLPTASPYLTPGPGYTYPPGKVPPTSFPGEIPTLSPFKPFPPGMLPTVAPYLTPGPGYTYPPGKVPTQYPGQTFQPGKEPTLSPNKPFPPGLLPTIRPYFTPGPGYTYPPGKVPTQYPGQTFAPGKEPTLAPYQTFPPGLGPTLSPYLTPGPGYTYPPGKVPPTQYPGQIPTLPPYQPFPLDLLPTASPYLTPGPGYTYPPGKVPTQYPGQTFKPGMEPTLAPYQTFPPDLLPTVAPYFTPGPGYTYPPGKVPTQYPGQTFAPGKAPTLPPWSPFPQGLGPTLSPYLTPGPGYTYPPGKVPPTKFPGEIPTLPPYQPFPLDLLPTKAPYITPGPGYTYPPGKVPTQYPGQTFKPGMEPTLAPYQTFPPDLLPTIRPYFTPGPGYTYPPGKVPPTNFPGEIPTLAPYKPFPPGLGPTLSPYLTPGPGYTYPPGKVPPTQYPGQIPTLPPFKPFPPGLIPTTSPYLTPGPGVTYPPGKVPTQYPGQTYPPGLAPTLAPNKPYPPGLLPTLSPYVTPGPGYTYPPGRVPTQYPGQTYQPGKEPTLAPYQTFPPGLQPTLSPYLTPGPGYTYPPGKVPPTRFPGEIPTLPPYQPFPPDLIPTVSPYRTPGPGYTYPPGKVPPTSYPGEIPTLPPYKPFPLDLYPTASPYLTPGPGYTYPPGKVPATQYPGQIPTLPPFKPFPPGLIPTASPYRTPGPGYTYPPGKVPPTSFPGEIPTLSPNKPFPPDLFPTLGPYATPGPGYTYPPGKVPPTTFPGEIPTLSPYKTFPPGLRPTLSPYITPGPGYTYPPGKVPTQYPGQTYQPGKEPTLPPYKPFPTGLLPTLSPYLTPGPGYTYPPGKVPTQYPGQTYPPGLAPTLSPYKPFPPDLLPTLGPYLTPGPGYTYPPGKVPTQYPGQTYAPGKAPTLPPYLPFPQGLIPTPGPTNAPTKKPYLIPTAIPGIITGQGVGVNGKSCMYKGVSYKEGDKWEDGCQYKCECMDDMKGSYQCKERCPTYTDVPASCRLTIDPKDSCCMIPSCAQPTPTPAPYLGPSTQTPPVTAKPDINACLYKGNVYTQGQKWYDDCDKVCVCQDAKMGFYSCQDRCAKYSNLGPNCVMVPDSRDPQCCQAPDCNNKNTTNIQGVQGTITGTGTLPPPTVVPGKPTIAPKAVCVYKGKQYTQGQKWQDGCSFDCECVDGKMGQFQCTDKCKRYPNLPPTCQMVYDSQNPCCEKPVCGLVPTAAPYLGPSTVSPPSQGPTTAPTVDFCIYNGILYRQGQTWQSGCDMTCRCDDAKSGLINCNERCPIYPALPASCTYVTDPKDPCCEVPSCISPNATIPTQVVNGTKGTVFIQPQLNPPVIGKRDVCVYKGGIYKQGQTWDDGCTYSCECVDASSGRFSCTDKCPRYPPLPAYCSMTQDPNNKCCQMSYCTPTQYGTTQVPTPGPSGLVPTAGPKPKDLCLYNGQLYKQSQQWYDGCNSVCVCEDASTGYYRCQPRCSKYSNVPAGCSLKPDPKDPSCCEVPYCPIVVPSIPPTPGVITPQMPQPGIITGTGKVPNLIGCQYKGQLYQPSQRFNDQCDYKCTCMDGNSGFYRCIDRCTKYTNIPKECVLVSDPNDKCCQVPYCDFKNPTPFPNGIPTPGPNMGPTPVPQSTISPPGTIPPQTGFCAYKGVYYTQGQTWKDGCNLQCRCEDVSKGIYSCTQRCNSYTNLPSSCTLKADPNDGCCLIPDCNKYPTPAPMVSPSPGQTTTHMPLVVPTPVKGSHTGTALQPGQPGTITGGQINYCVYKQRVYQQGQTWNDGCNFICTCEDASRGLYKCDDRCPKYFYLPPQCHYEQDPKDNCCQVAKCDFNPTLTPPPTTTTLPIKTTPGVATQKPNNVCVYIDGSQHSKGSKWYDACDYTCECKDTVTNFYNCTARCKAYSNLPSICTLKPDPTDSCCEVPDCGTYTPITGNTITGTLPPNKFNLVPIGTHSVFSGSSQNPNAIQGTRDACIYKNKVYKQGVSWDDGCDYVCTCLNGPKGLYRCISKCPAYPALPSYCKKNMVPGQCCPVIGCDVPGFGTINPDPQLVPTPAPTKIGVIPTPAPTSLVPVIQINPNPSQNTTGGIPGGGYPIKPNQITGISNQCVYKNKVYNKGESWDIDCDFTCTCVDGSTGYYECKPQCPTYNNLPPQCFTTTVQGKCCKTIQCTTKDGLIVKPNAQFPVVGSYTGGFSGFRPGVSYNPGINSTSGVRLGCIYKGQLYKAGDEWDDGCDFHCKCVDSKTGRYQCTAQCPEFTRLPALCELVPVSGQCCKRLQCRTPTTVAPGVVTPTPFIPTPDPHPGCTDVIDNCADYGQSVCQQPYDAWGRRNCQHYCGMCPQPGMTTPTTSCQDKLPNCDLYGKKVCFNEYVPWAKENCQHHCSMCADQMTTATPSCVDKNPSACAEIGPDVCSILINFAKENCAHQCNLCPTPSVPSVQVTTPSPNGYVLLMKGVTGVGTYPPGVTDLFGLWNSTKTINQFQPGANSLTPNFPGHYKPGLSNNWPSLCLDKVRVSIYKNGVEKAFMLFNATGADKMSWFTPSRIIDSSWVDLQSTTKQYFAMSQDPDFLREFYASQNADKSKCDSTGWMFISTANRCFLETDKKPAFYYAPGQSSAHWGYTKAGVGDVFTIQGHSKCPNNVVLPTVNTTGGGCLYKGKLYHQGDNWEDGCDYNCTCDDEQSGHYSCNALCPIYDHLPKLCEVVIPNGQCCGHVECRPDRGGIITAPPNTCFYKGQYYGQDDTWIDDCKYKCECLQANLGFYRCKELCYKWQLPSQCTLEEPAPGKCCKTPSCPPWITIQYPSGYKEE